MSTLSERGWGRFKPDKGDFRGHTVLLPTKLLTSKVVFSMLIWLSHAEVLNKIALNLPRYGPHSGL